jgi:hypothetical protein
MATIWHNIQPMDTVGEYLTRYEVSQRACQIIRQELLKPQWWNFAIGRFATELSNEDADHAEAVFQQVSRITIRVPVTSTLQTIIPFLLTMILATLPTASLTTLPTTLLTTLPTSLPTSLPMNVPRSSAEGLEVTYRFQ